ncbi:MULTISPECIES: hypothetical protein [Asticcacaulis]|uniref:hypothetical protein n=1 Tax=Asticcacaulis TaxID=76890 RepID=UPI001AE7437A|nr:MULTISPECIES: hypothetical protein [Asticcacaulis]MBP2161637.1 hypothetical protein [Asticcacaulis solisilvae]MDR6802738.1 hypothetical protein [Asticcacaulis sp. BE141]
MAGVDNSGLSNSTGKPPVKYPGLKPLLWIVLGVPAFLLVLFVGMAIAYQVFTPAEEKAANSARWAEERAAKAAAKAQAAAAAEKETLKAAKNDTPSALKEIRLAFRGTETPEASEQIVNETLTAFAEPLNEDSYGTILRLVQPLADKSRMTEAEILKCMSAAKSTNPKGILTLNQAAAMCVSDEKSLNYDTVFTYGGPVCAYLTDVDKAIQLWQNGNSALIESQTSCFFVSEGTKAVSVDSASGYKQLILVDENGQTKQVWTDWQLISSL